MECRKLAGIAIIGVLALARVGRADLEGSIEKVLREPYLKNVTVGIKVVRLGETAADSKTVYEKDATRQMTPASNLKLVTTAAALETLGADFQFQTKLMQKGNTLALVGDGDPMLGDAEVLHKVDWQSTTLFEKWAQGLAARGLKSADQLVYDDSIFDEQYICPTWPADQIQKRYVAGVAGLNFNANCLDFYLKPGDMGKVVDYTMDPPTAYTKVNNTCVRGRNNAVWLTRANGSAQIELHGQINYANQEPVSVTVDNPPLFTATVLKETFQKAGIPIGGEIQRDPTVRTSPEAWQTLAVNQTPIAQVIARANKDSMNLYAEALCKRLGAAASKGSGSWSNGPPAVGAFLQSIGVEQDQFSLEDGCGLSRKDTVSPGTLVAVLEHEYFSKNRDIYLNSLAIAGVDGTLKHRFDDTPMRHRVVGKSGFIDGVSALSGFVKSKDGSQYVFSILFNGIAKGTNSTAKDVQERIVMALN
ncbi:MAG: D-alanyl-D-alanine carboxypeptidase/D-alanyl-D-alanine endopeptidase [Tepidisphaeraceae bacterium]